MSYDVSLTVDTGVENVTVVDVGNYTSNVGNMFKRALGFRLGELDGMVAGDIIEALDTGVGDMERFPEEYRKMNPKNGWGDYEGALQYLISIAYYCRRHPNCTIRVCS